MGTLKYILIVGFDYSFRTKRTITTIIKTKSRIEIGSKVIIEKTEAGISPSSDFIMGVSNDMPYLGFICLHEEKVSMILSSVVLKNKYQ